MAEMQYRLLEDVAYGKWRQQLMYPSQFAADVFLNLVSQYEIWLTLLTGTDDRL